MTKRNHALLCDLLDELCATPIYTAACARCGISTKSLWRYIRASQSEDDAESYRFVWCDVEDWFHHHIKHAMRLSALMIEATARHHALNGFDEVQVFQGKISWKEDPKLAGLSDHDLGLLGYADRYERDAYGALIPLTVRRKPSDQLVLKMLAAHFPRTYGDKVEHQHSGIIGVMRMGRDGKMRPNAPAAKLEDQSDELVVSADSGPVELSQMKIGLVVGEPLDSEELERYAAGLEAEPMDFENEDGSVVRMEVDGTSTVVKPPRQESAATTEAERVPADRGLSSPQPGRPRKRPRWAARQQRRDDAVFLPMAPVRRARVHCPAATASREVIRTPDNRIILRFGQASADILTVPSVPVGLVLPEAFELVRRQGRVSSRVLDVAVAEVSLQRAGIFAVIRELKTAGVSQHMGVRLDAEIGHDRRPLDHAGKAGRRQRRTAFRHEHERRLFALPFMFAERPHFPAGQRMCGRRSVLDATDVQGRGLEVDLFPAQIADLGGAQPVPEG